MIDTALNLLSPTKKHRLKSLIKFLFIKEYLEIFIFTVTILAIAHLGAWFILTRVTNDLSRSTLLINRDFSALNQNIRVSNKLIKAVFFSGNQFYPLAPRVAELFRLVPPGVNLTGLNINRVGGTVTISGLAATRDALISFQDALGQLPWIDSVSAPQSQLFQKNNISFEISANLKSGILIEPNAVTATAANGH